MISDAKRIAIITDVQRSGNMTIDEIIAKEIEIAQEFQEVIDTHITGGSFSLEEMYCDDTEVIEEHLQRCKVFADYHTQIANTMRKYQKIEQIVKTWDDDENAMILADELREVIEDEIS